ncbi:MULTISPECIES: hypothetical protein [Thermoprotei]|uniref:hypothetical protein n=1 Tax=Thermoprotei TaxID=183924 RepID=UPI00316166A0
MVSRNRTYTSDSDSQYRKKMVRQNLAYLRYEDAVANAEAKLANWKAVFVELYHAVHANPLFIDAMKYVSSGAYKGVVTRYANYFLANVLFTGRVSVQYFLSKLVSQGLSEDSANIIAGATACASITIPSVKSFIATLNPMLSSALVSACSSIPAGDPYANLSGYQNVVNALEQNPMPNVPRSYLYYVISGITTQATTGGSAGGEASSPSFVPVPVSPSSASQGLEAIISNLTKLGGGV